MGQTRSSCWRRSGRAYPPTRWAGIRQAWGASQCRVGQPACGVGVASLALPSCSASPLPPVPPAFLPQVTPQQRAHAKQLTYGLLYGMGASKLAEELGCSLVEAREAQVGAWGGVHCCPAQMQRNCDS